MAQWVLFEIIQKVLVIQYLHTAEVTKISRVEILNRINLNSNSMAHVIRKLCASVKKMKDLFQV